MGPLSKDDDPGGKYYRVLGAGKVSESTALGSRLGYNRDFKGILYIWRPCFRRKKEIETKLERSIKCSPKRVSRVLSGPTVIPSTCYSLEQNSPRVIGQAAV
jgi:hypothetical protein|uniref:Uncharacterized protein n=1 Tax=Mus musculus TaxID=10090 RepID=Q8CEB5_MOUSE|nr:unnamed protein product [Mus musculus]